MMESDAIDIAKGYETKERSDSWSGDWSNAGACRQDEGKTCSSLGSFAEFWYRVDDGPSHC